jgi:hypothetical protein
MSENDAVAPLTTTIKLPGVSAPWIVVRSENSAQLDAQLNELMANGVGATLGRAQDMIEAQYNTGKGLGARAVDAPVDTGAYAPPAQQYQQPQVQPAAPIGYAQPQEQPQYQQPAPQQQYQQPAAPAPQGATPGAPMVAGMPAKLVSGNKNGRQWQAWADPRPKEVTEHMQRTDDPNHPGLAQGTHSLWKFIR